LKKKGRRGSGRIKELVGVDEDGKIIVK